MLSIGLYEELLFRGFTLNIMLSKWGNTKKGIYKSAILSSMIFGIIHFVNLVSSPNLIIATTVQVFYATFIGVFLAGVYLRSTNILSVIILHALYDFTAFFTNMFCTNNQQSSLIMLDIHFENAIGIFISTLPFLIIGLFLLRKVEPKKVI